MKYSKWRRDKVSDILLQGGRLVDGPYTPLEAREREMCNRLVLDSNLDFGNQSLKIDSLCIDVQDIQLRILGKDLNIGA